MRQTFLAALIAGGVLVANPARAQAPYEDTRGQTTLIAPGAGSVSVNTTDTSASFSYIHLISNAAPVWGLRLKGKSTDGVAALLSKGAFSPGFEGAVFVGGKLGGAKGKTIGLVRLAWVDEATTMVDPAAAFSDQISKGTFHGWELGLDLSGPHMIAGWPSQFGVSASIKKTHNYQDLDEVTIDDRHTIGTGADGTVRQTVDTVSGRTGSYERGTGFNLGADYVAQIASSRFAIRGLVRSINGAGANIDATRIGVDVSVFKEHGDFIKDRLLGVVFEVDDLFKQRPQPGTLRDRFAASLVVTLPLSGMQ
jgi:hypothetical protein